jgi:hypothetical protein
MGAILDRAKRPWIECSRGENAVETMRGSWRKLHNEVFCNLFFSPNNMRIIEGEVFMALTMNRHFGGKVGSATRRSIPEDDILQYKD